MNLIRPAHVWSTSRQPRDVRAAVLLVRHAETDLSARRLCGRLPGIHLNARGRAQTRALCARLARLPVGAVYSSPLERAIETASPIAEARGLRVVIDEAVNEIDFGEWTGLTFDALECREEWRRYNASRDGAQVPGGESPAETRRRIVDTVDTLALRHPRDLIVVVTHAELIRYAWLSADGRSLDQWSAVDVALASVTTFCLAPMGS